MYKTDPGELSRYVRRVMRERRLKQREVERRSGGKITDGYVADILCGRAKNPSVEKIMALARGLDVDASELFAVACAPLEINVGKNQNVDLPDTLSFLAMMREVAESEDLTKIVEETIRLMPQERAIVLRSIESINERKHDLESGERKTQRSREKA